MTRQHWAVVWLIGPPLVLFVILLTVGVWVEP